ncbi:MAG: FlgD immunoglobulin-like domain containing protein, partial [Acidobacteriota bacterium]
MTQDGAVTLGTVTGLTATGNTNNAIEIRASTPGANTTWKNVGLPFVVTGDIYVQGAATPVLTVQPGVTVKFNANATLYIGYNPSGGLLAVGTAVQPIVFTANTATPTPGYWRGIWLWTYAAATSQIAYATVSYAGVASGAGGLHVSSTTPALLDHLNLTSNAYAGISLSGSSPRISNCNFVGNTNGIVNQSATQLIDARLNWWGSSTGPSSSGPGTGQPVTTGVKFEPWLGASSTAPQWFSSFGLGNRTFNPTLAIFANFSFQTPLSGNWTVKIFNTGNALVRTISGTGSANAASWDGKNGSGVLQPNGIYSYQVDSLAGSQGASPAVGGVVMDTTRQLAVSGFGLTPAFFSPNADGVQDTTTVSGVASFDGATWTLRVRTGGGTVVRTISGAATPTVSCVWDGRSDANAIQPEGTYTLELTVVDGSATSISSGPAVLDVTPPVSAISAPSAGATLSNVYQSGSSNVAVTGTATDTNLQAWTLEWGTGSNPSSWNSISGAATPVSSGALGSWATQANPNGSYTLRVVVNDKAGNRTTATRTLPVSNFSVSNTIYQFNGTTGGTVAYTSVVPFTLTETLFIKNAAGQTVRTIFSGSRLAGTFVDSWNGRNDANALVPDGPYFYYATATSGTSAMTWDLTNQYLNDLLIDVTGALYNNGHVVQQPFNNQPMPLTYSFGSTNRPARVWFYFSPNVGYLQTLNAMPDPSGCSIPPDFCMPAGEYQESGTFTVTWPGLDPAGVLRKDIKAIVLELRTDTFSKNAVVLFGSKPVLTNLRVDPPSYGPAGGNQVVSFDVTTYQTAPVSATVTFRNQSSMSVLRTLTAASQPPGHISIPWDGHADNGMWVAPGFYTVTLTITDPIGNQRTSQVLTDIEY